MNKNKKRAFTFWERRGERRGRKKKKEREKSHHVTSSRHSIKIIKNMKNGLFLLVVIYESYLDISGNDLLVVFFVVDRIISSSIITSSLSPLLSVHQTRTYTRITTTRQKKIFFLFCSALFCSQLCFDRMQVSYRGIGRYNRY